MLSIICQIVLFYHLVYKTYFSIQFTFQYVISFLDHFRSDLFGVSVVPRKVMKSEDEFH